MSSILLLGDTSGSITVAAPAVAGSGTLTLPTGTATLAINGPAFFVYSTSTTTLTQNTFTTVIMDTEVYDTANCFNTSTYAFTPNVAGYYQINANVSYAPGTGGTATNFVCSIGKNGTEYQRGSGTNIISTGNNYYLSASAVVYCNGTTDYITTLCYSSASGNQLQTSQAGCGMSGFLARAA